MPLLCFTFSVISGSCSFLFYSSIVFHLLFFYSTTASSFDTSETTFTTESEFSILAAVRKMWKALKKKFMSRCYAWVSDLMICGRLHYVFFPWKPCWRFQCALRFETLRAYLYCLELWETSRKEKMITEHLLMASCGISLIVWSVHLHFVA